MYALIGLRTCAAGVLPPGLHIGIIGMHTMKTAISVDDQLMIAADRAAREIGVSRSRLFSLALKDYLRKRQQDKIVEQLNQVYGSKPDAAKKRTAARLKTKFRRTIKERW